MNTFLTLSEKSRVTADTGVYRSAQLCHIDASAERCVPL